MPCFFRMKILVIGSGAREHALCWKLAQEAEVTCAPGNPGIAENCVCEAVSASEKPGMQDLCTRLKPDLVVVGPEDPLIDGLADDLRDAGWQVVGPGSEGTRLEASKAFSKKSKP